MIGNRPGQIDSRLAYRERGGRTIPIGNQIFHVRGARPFDQKSEIFGTREQVFLGCRRLADNSTGSWYTEGLVSRGDFSVRESGEDGFGVARLPACLPASLRAGLLNLTREGTRLEGLLCASRALGNGKAGSRSVMI